MRFWRVLVQIANEVPEGYGMLWCRWLTRFQRVMVQMAMRFRRVTVQIARKVAEGSGADRWLTQSIPDWKISIEIDFFNRKKSISKIQSRIHRFQSCDFQSIFQSNLLQNSIEFSIEFSIGNSIEKTCFYLGFLELSSLHVLCFLLFSRAIHPMCFFLLSGASQPTWAFAFSSQLQHSSRLSSGIPENL